MRLDFTQDATIHKHMSTQALPQPLSRDPSLPHQRKPLKYVDVFVDDFIGLAQGKEQLSQVRSIILKSIDSVFRPNDYHDGPHRREPVSLKKQRKGESSWSTVKTVLGWIVDTTNMTISLPSHRRDRLNEILLSIKPTQKRVSVKKWHKVLGELRSMSLALPGARNLFSHLQEALTGKQNQRIALRKGVHDSIKDFKWMLQDISRRPTRIAELVPLPPSALGYHDASGIGAGGVWTVASHVNPRGTSSPQPLLWRLTWPVDIRNQLITDLNPNGTITISDLELAGSLLHLDIIAQNYDIRERTILSKTDNMATLFWTRKGSTSTSKVPAYLLRLFGIHQRYHRYVPRYDYEPGQTNSLADDASRRFDLKTNELLTLFNSRHKQQVNWRLVHPRQEIITAVFIALRKQTSNAECLLVEPPPPVPIGKSGSSSPIDWASIKRTPF